MGLKDVHAAIKIYKTREFSSTAYAVKKIVKLMKMGVGCVFDDEWLSLARSKLLEAETLNEVETIVRNQWETLTLPDAVTTSGAYAAKVLFLYLRLHGRKQIIKTIKAHLKKPISTLKFELVNEKSINDFWVTFEAVSTELNRNPNDEFKKWLKSLDQVELWTTEVPDGIKIVDWASFQNSADKKFGQSLLHAIKEVAVDNVNVYSTVACTTILKEFKSHCLKLCMDVLKACDFETEEIEVVSRHVNQEAASPLSELCRILGTASVRSSVDAQRLKQATLKMKAIAGQKDSGFSQEMWRQLYEHLKKRLNSSSFLEQLVQDAMPTTLGRKAVKAAVVYFTEATVHSVPCVQKQNH